jgi:hypothetical protein
MRCPRSAAMSSRSCASRSRWVSSEDNLPHVIDVLHWPHRRRGFAFLSLSHIDEESWSLVSSRILGYHHLDQARSKNCAAGVIDACGLPTEVWVRPRRL